jgi:hypothetical protein
MSRIALLTLIALLPTAQAQDLDKHRGHGNSREFRAILVGNNEVPAVSSVANGGFRARLNSSGTALHYQLAYTGLEGDVTQAHIHFGQRDVNGGIAVWLCSNLASPPTPAGVQACPAPPANITGTIMAADVVGPGAQGIDPGEFAELVGALRRGQAYANVHSSRFPGGEVRSQLRRGY